MATTLISHSWSNKTVHIFRSDGRVVRAKVGHLLFQDHGLYMRLRFRDGSKFQKLVSPTMIATVHMFWINVDVVSDVDLDDLDGDESKFEVPQEVPRDMEPLTIDATSRSLLSLSQIEALECVMTDIRHILNVLN